jgi:hypothetical protein
MLSRPHIDAGLSSLMPSSPRNKRIDCEDGIVFDVKDFLVTGGMDANRLLLEGLTRFDEERSSKNSVYRPLSGWRGKAAVGFHSRIKYRRPDGGSDHRDH